MEFQVNFAVIIYNQNLLKLVYIMVFISSIVQQVLDTSFPHQFSCFPSLKYWVPDT